MNRRALLLGAAALLGVGVANKPKAAVSRVFRSRGTWTVPKGVRPVSIGWGTGSADPNVGVMPSTGGSIGPITRVGMPGRSLVFSKDSVAADDSLAFTFKVGQ